MNGEALWNLMKEEVSVAKLDLQTAAGLWFSVSSFNDLLNIDITKDHSPSCKLTSRRSISRKDFLNVYSYFNDWSEEIME